MEEQEEEEEEEEEQEEEEGRIMATPCSGGSTGPVRHLSPLYTAPYSTMCT